jgi:uncharacterized spore protein YtfJ
MSDKFDLDRFFDELGDARKQASVDGVFGTPIETEGKTVIPIASALYGFGMGGGSGQREEHSDLGGGGGAGYVVRPMAMAVIDQAGVRIEPIVNVERMGLAGMLLGAWFAFWLGRVLLRLASARR